MSGRAGDAGGEVEGGAGARLREAAKSAAEEVGAARRRDRGSRVEVGEDELGRAGVVAVGVVEELVEVVDRTEETLAHPGSISLGFTELDPNPAQFS